MHNSSSAAKAFLGALHSAEIKGIAAMLWTAYYPQGPAWEPGTQPHLEESFYNMAEATHALLNTMLNNKGGQS